MTMQTNRSDPASAPVGANTRLRDSGQPTMTTFIHQELSDFDQRAQRRARVVGRLLFLQVALLAMTAPLAVWPSVAPSACAVTLVGFALYVFIWIRNISGKVEQAQTLLIVSSGLVTAASVVTQMLAHQGQILPMGLATLPFLLTVIEAGLLMIPEVVLITAIATTGFTALALVATIALSSQLDLVASTTYLLAVTVLGLQALVGIIAWQVAHFILDYSIELNQTRRDAFIATQFEALQRSVKEQEMRQREQIVMLIQGIVALTSRDYTARANISEGPLKPLADTVNILAAQLSAVAASEQAQVNMNSAALQIADIAGQIAEGDASPGSATPLGAPPTTTGSLMQGAIVTLHKARISMQRRLGHVRDLAFDVGQRLNQVNNRAHDAERVVADNLATIGLLRAEADRVSTSAARLNQLIDDALRALGPLMPLEVRSQVRFEPRDPHGGLGLQQVMPGVTIQLDAITDETEETEPEGGTRPLAAIPPVESGAGTLDPGAQTRLREVWSHLIEMTEEVAKQVRDAFVLQEKLGISSKSLRGVDTDLRQLRTMLINIRDLAQEVYHTSNTTTQPLAAGIEDLNVTHHTSAPLPPAQPSAQTLTPTEPLSGPGHIPPASDPPLGQINASDLIDGAFGGPPSDEQPQP